MENQSKCKWQQAAVLLVFSALLCTLIFLLPEHAEPQQPPVSIVFLHGAGGANENDVRMREIYARFEKSHPDIDLVIETCPSDLVAQERAQELLMAGRAPDVFYCGGETRYLRNAIAMNKAVDLRPYLEQRPQLAENVAPGALSAWDRAGKVYTLPDQIEVKGYWYNADLLRKAGIELPSVDTTQPAKSWADFFAACKTLDEYFRQNDIAKQSIWLYNQSAFETLLQGMLASETQMDGGSFDSVQVEESWLREKLDLLEGLTTPSGLQETGSQTDALDDFCSGKTAIYVGSLTQAEKIASSAYADSIFYAAFPGSNGQPMMYQSYPAGYVVGNNGDAKKVEAALEFLEYMTSQEVQQEILDATGLIPQNPKLDLSAVEERGEMYRKACRAAESAVQKILPAEIAWSYPSLMTLDREAEDRRGKPLLEIE